MSRRIEAYFLVGPTAAGKTDIAQRIAADRGFDILSADSMLIYQGMDIGTAKPGPAERGTVRYWGMDLVSPAECFSVGAYRAMAEGVLRHLAQENRRAIVVGGTGLYIKSLTHGLDALPASRPERRAYWQRRLADDGAEGLAATLRQMSRASYESLTDPRNPRRLLRAIELAEAGVSARSAQWAAAPESAPLVGLSLPRAVLHERIAIRVKAMYDRGLLEEVRRLSAFLSPDSTAWQAIGYAEAAMCLRGECTRDEAMQMTIVRTRRLAKRQMTWFRHQARVVWVDVDPEAPASETARQVERLWQQLGPTAIAGIPA